MTVVVRQKAGWEVVKFIRSRCSNLNWIEKLEWGRSLSKTESWRALSDFSTGALPDGIL